VVATAGRPRATPPPARRLRDRGTATVDGGDGDDDDVIQTAKAPDVLIGGAGRDVLDGGAGNDQLFALDGAKDTLRGGLGVDTADATPSTRSTR